MTDGGAARRAARGADAPVGRRADLRRAADARHARRHRPRARHTAATAPTDVSYDHVRPAAATHMARSSRDSAGSVAFE